MFYRAGQVGSALGLPFIPFPTARRWLACLLLAQIPLIASLAANTNSRHLYEPEGPIRVVHVAAHRLEAQRGHDLMNLLDPRCDGERVLKSIRRIVLELADIVATTVLGWLNFRMRQNGKRVPRRPGCRKPLIKHKEPPPVPVRVRLSPRADRLHHSKQSVH